MHIRTKFDLGDEVFHIRPDREELKLPCRFCRGAGWMKVEGAGGGEAQVKCPRCGGIGHGHTSAAVVSLGTWPQWKVTAGALRIGSIEVSVFDHAARGGDDHLQAGEDQERYMAWSTGVGSGSVYDSRDLFATVEEAQEEADLRTERQRHGEAPCEDRQTRFTQWWPTTQQVGIARGFLDHRDVYEHDASHVLLAEAIVAAGAARDSMGS